MLFEIAKLVETVIILGKIAILPWSSWFHATAVHCCYLRPHRCTKKPIFVCKVMQFCIRYSDYGSVRCRFSEKGTFHGIFVKIQRPKSQKQGQKWISCLKEIRFFLISQVVPFAQKLRKKPTFWDKHWPKLVRKGHFLGQRWDHQCPYHLSTLA